MERVFLLTLIDGDTNSNTFDTCSVHDTIPISPQTHSVCDESAVQIITSDLRPFIFHFDSHSVMESAEQSTTEIDWQAIEFFFYS